MPSDPIIFFSALVPSILATSIPVSVGRLVVLWAGYPFSRDYKQARGHMYAIDDIRSTLRARFGGDVQIRLIAEARGSFIARLLRRAAPGGTGLADEALGAIEERAAWARFGL